MIAESREKHWTEKIDRPKRIEYKSKYWYDLAGQFIYCALLVLAYTSYVARVHDYEGYVLKFDQMYALQSLLALALCSFLAGGASGVRDLYGHVAILLVVTPALVLVSFGNLRGGVAVITVLAYVTMQLAARFGAARGKASYARESEKVRKAVTIAAIVGVLILVAHYGPSGINFSVDMVYERRRILASESTLLSAYLLSPVVLVLLPAATVLSFRAKRIKTVIALVATAFVMYGLTSHKSCFIYPLLAICLFIAGASKAPALVMIGLAILMVLLGIGDYWYSEQAGIEPIWGSLLIRRALFLPAVLNSYYIEWYSLNPLALWADSKLTFGMLASQERLPPAILIGAEYFASNEVSANVGWIGSGYANGGILGVLAYSLLLGIVVSYFDRQAKVLGLPLVLGLAGAQLTIALNSTDLLTLLLTHGLFVTIAILWQLTGRNPNRGI